MPVYKWHNDEMTKRKNGEMRLAISLYAIPSLRHLQVVQIIEMNFCISSNF